jgi:hypothetical protein
MFVAVVLAACWHIPFVAGDLAKIERRINKEPMYQGKPKYCLLVFGPEAKHRVWLVQDGDVLYADFKGDGDLTRPEAKIASDKEESRDGSPVFKVTEFRVGGQVHKNLHIGTVRLDNVADRDAHAKALVAKDANAVAYAVVIDMEIPGFKGDAVGGRVRQCAAYLDANGVLQFADSAAKAPILHFGGPLEITLFSRHELKIGRANGLVLGVGSPGVGPGSHTWIDYENVIPEKAYPTVEFVYPPKAAGEPPVRIRHELKHRC